MSEKQKKAPPEPKKEKRNLAEQYELVADYLRLKYSVRYNVVRLVPELYLESEKAFAEMDDYHFNSLLLDVKKAGYKVNEKVLKTVLCSNLIPKVDPLIHFFENLPKWDGVDHIDALAATLETGGIDDLPDAKDFWNLMFKRFMVSIVATVVSKRQGQLCLVLTGGQGLGKSTWLNKLCPEDKNYDFMAVGGMTTKITDKQTINLLAEKMLINLDDQLDSYSWHDYEQLKSIITSTKLTTRKAYAHHDATRYRRATIVASTNNLLFLKDTHNRRYLVFEVLGIDLKMHAEIDMLQVYAQAKALFQEGFRYWLDSVEQDKLNILNAKFRDVAPEEELVNQYLEPAEAQDAEADLLTATEIKAKLELHSGIKNLYPKAIGKALKALGFQRKSVREGGNTPRYRWVVKTNWPH